METITILLAEDHTIVREGLRALLEADGDIKVVGEAATGRQAVALTSKVRPDVVVMDIAMPDLNGLEATRQILKSNPGAKVIILSAHGDNAYVEQATALGAKGFLLKQASAHIMSNAVREVQKGNTLFNPSIARQLQEHDMNAPPPVCVVRDKKSFARLSSREIEVLQLIAEGRANKQVAAELDISFKTVEKHRQRLMEKLNIHDTAGLTRYAISAGIIESSVQLTIV